MKTIQPAPLLKFALMGDAAACAPLAVLQLAMPATLAGMLVLPKQLLVGSALFLLAYVVLLIVLARSASVWRPLIQLIIIGNIGWAAGCVALIAVEPSAPSMLGLLYLGAQAAAVLGLAALEYAGLRASTPTAAGGRGPGYA